MANLSENSTSSNRVSPHRFVSCGLRHVWIQDQYKGLLHQPCTKYYIHIVLMYSLYILDFKEMQGYFNHIYFADFYSHHYTYFSSQIKINLQNLQTISFPSIVLLLGRRQMLFIPLGHKTHIWYLLLFLSNFLVFAKVKMSFKI